MLEQNNNNVTPTEVLNFLKDNMVMREDFENRMGGVENRMGGLENRMGGLENRIESLEEKITHLALELQEVREKIEDIEKRIFEDANILAQEVYNLRRRLEVAEQAIQKLQLNYSKV